MVFQSAIEGSVVVEQPPSTLGSPLHLLYSTFLCASVISSYVVLEDDSKQLKVLPVLLCLQGSVRWTAFSCIRFLGGVLCRAKQASLLQ